jgi:hypothetical protein
MFVKFKYVAGAAVVVVGVGVLAVLGLGGFFLGTTATETPVGPVVTGPAPEAQPVGTPAPAQPLASAPTGGGKYAAAVRAANGTASPNSKKKDALGASGWKINLYEETGDAHYDRAKVDRDRDDSWDEKWNWKGGRWERDGGAEIWDGKAWVAAGGERAEPKADAKNDPPAAANAGGDTGLAKYAKRVLNERASGKKAKDITGGSGPKINLYDDDQDGKWDRGKVDLDRDDTWDQKWTVKGGKLERKVEATGEVHVFEDGAWVAKKK